MGFDRYLSTVIPEAMQASLRSLHKFGCMRLSGIHDPRTW
jgi:hypothetical protein